MDNQPLEKPKRVNLDNFILLNDMTDEQLDKQHKIEMKRMKKIRVQRYMDKNKKFFG
tara:strand:+ start:504 stop:674 length:171 start_codon:yes stop_codon:yes gene_type:complete